MPPFLDGGLTGSSIRRGWHCWSRQGSCRAGLKLLTDYAHKVAGLPRVYLETEPDDEPSGGVACRAGYQLTDLPPNVVMDKSREVLLLTWEHLGTSVA
ncbi:MAG: hypothetical protein QOH50_4142 [Kribbellaceae bacterium]|nr:hypothetical protein [Kribbellaceae bacterium]